MHSFVVLESYIVWKSLFMDFLFSFSAGYNNVEVAEFLLENGADVNAQDKGGLIPLHNASSYGVSVSQRVMLMLSSQYQTSDLSLL